MWCFLKTDSNHPFKTVNVVKFNSVANECLIPQQLSSSIQLPGHYILKPLVLISLLQSPETFFLIHPFHWWRCSCRACTWLGRWHSWRCNWNGRWLKHCFWVLRSKWLFWGKVLQQLHEPLNVPVERLEGNGPLIMEFLTFLAHVKEMMGCTEALFRRGTILQRQFASGH